MQVGGFDKWENFRETRDLGMLIQRQRTLKSWNDTTDDSLSSRWIEKLDSRKIWNWNFEIQGNDTQQMSDHVVQGSTRVFPDEKTIMRSGEEAENRQVEVERHRDAVEFEGHLNDQLSLGRWGKSSLAFRSILSPCKFETEDKVEGFSYVSQTWTLCWIKLCIAFSYGFHMR